MGKEKNKIVDFSKLLSILRKKIISMNKRHLYTSKKGFNTIFWLS